MAVSETDILEKVKAGGKITGDDTLTPGYRGEVVRLMTIFVDTELAWVSEYADQINRAPGIRERVVAARIVAEKLDHAQRVLALLEAFGVNPELYVRSHAWTARLDRSVDLGTRQVGDDKRLNVLHYPIQGWTDSVTMNALFGPATIIHLTEVANCSHAALAETMAGILERERGHAEAAIKGLRQAVERDGSPAAAQVAVDYWYPRIADTFGRSDSTRYEQYRAYGLRQHTNAELLATWKQDVAPILGGMGLTAPAGG
ncbi:MAG: phenylacetate-CoA oxygenase subunit PaaI [Hyphomicrobiales bacterium]|nr:phenylacetate-CoA oxygenase subunit PaaI [Hyphomicrobiales bacterium]